VHGEPGGGTGVERVDPQAPILTRTFCHIPGIGRQWEQRLWAQGVRSWHDACQAELTGARGQAIRTEAEQSIRRHQQRDARYFASALPAREHWRLYGSFCDSVAYLDIETTGLGGYDDHVTTIALYDGHTIRHYVHGRNIADFECDIAAYDLVVTFNGKSFDLPFLRRFLRVDVDAAHIDLMHVLRSCGQKGGLKAIERRYGYDRPDMADVDGYMAVLLWREFERTGDPRVLDTLLAYNIQDVLTLELLAAEAYNAKLAATPFARELALPVPRRPADNPFAADRGVIERLRGSLWGWGEATEHA
jgi:uncharacterized protein YprB with RNaseH-like and TPR domain